MTELPQPVAALVDELAASQGALAVMLGGSRAQGGSDLGSDFDLGLYYRGRIDLGPLAAHGAVHAPGSWGRVMNGGAWLSCGGHKVDVLLRDLHVVEHWTERAEAGEFELDALLGYTAGIPTYVLAAELATGRVLRGSVPHVSFPRKLMDAAPPKGGSAVRSASNMRVATLGAETSLGPSLRPRERRSRRRTRDSASAANGCATRSACSRPPALPRCMHFLRRRRSRPRRSYRG